MTAHRSFRLVLAAGAAFTAACSEAPGTRLSPSVPALSASKSAKNSPTAQRDTPLAADLSRSITVDSRGGTLEIPEAGLKLSVPSNALPSGTPSVTITVTAYAGSQFAYDFQPAGISFTQPLKFEQDLGNARPDKQMLATPVVSYFRARGDINARSRSVVTFEDLLSNFDVSGHKVKADVWHFSGYIVCWGRN